MKYIVLIICSLTIYSCTWKRTKEEDKYKYNLILFKADSGYVNKKDALAFLLKNQLTDTIESFWSLHGDSESIGKYYRIKNSKDYLLCVMDLSKKYTFETHLLMKTNSKGEITDTSRFMHWNYSSCLDNKAEAFNKYGDYYGLSICQTGSGFSAHYVYFFKDFVYQEKQNPILLFLYSGMGYLSETITSSMKINNDIINVDYEVETIRETYKTETKTVKFNADYFLKNNKWETKDSSKFNVIESVF